MDLCRDLELSMGNYLKNFGPNEKKVSPTRIRLQLRPCHPDQHGHYSMLQLLMGFLSFGNRQRHVNLSIIGIKILFYVKTGDNSAEWCGL